MHEYAKKFIYKTLSNLCYFTNTVNLPPQQALFWHFQLTTQFKTLSDWFLALLIGLKKTRAVEIKFSSNFYSGQILLSIEKSKINAPEAFIDSIQVLYLVNAEYNIWLIEDSRKPIMDLIA